MKFPGIFHDATDECRREKDKIKRVGQNNEASSAMSKAKEIPRWFLTGPLLILLSLEAGLGLACCRRQSRLMAAEKNTNDSGTNKTGGGKDTLPITPLKLLGGQTPFGFHTALTFMPGMTPDERAKDPFRLADPYSRVRQTKIGWERPIVYAGADGSRELFDRVFGSAPDFMNILANIDVRSFCYGRKPDLTPEQRKNRIYLPAASCLQLKDEDAYLSFLNRFAERYDGDGKDDMPGLKNPVFYYQIDNELPGPPVGGDLRSMPYDPGNSSWLERSVANYSDILRKTRKGIKAANPKAKIVMAGLMDLGPATPRLFEAYFMKVLQNVGPGVIDVFDFHFYGNAVADWKIMRAVYDMCREGLNKTGNSDVEIWVGETATHTGPAQTERQQAIDLIRRLVFPVTFGVKVVLWAPGIFDFPYGDGDDSRMGLIRRDGIPKLSYFSHKKLCDVLAGADFNHPTEVSAHGAYVYKFKKGNHGIYVAWAQDPVARDVLIPGVDSRRVEVIRAVPEYARGQDVPAYEGAFTIRNQDAVDHAVIVSLGDVPLFIEEIPDLSSGAIQFGHESKGAALTLKKGTVE